MTIFLFMRRIRNWLNVEEYLAHKKQTTDILILIMILAVYGNPVIYRLGPPLKQIYIR